MYFEYSEREIEYLKVRDKRLGEAIDRIGPIEREVDPDLFSSLIRAIIGQQISTKAQETIYGRMLEKLGEITPESICVCGSGEIQTLGISHRKAEYIADISKLILSGKFDLRILDSLPDGDVVAALSSLRGIGVWTAEMLMMFSMCRPDIFSFGDLAIHRGLRMLYRHREIDRARFEKYRRRYSPYGSVASLYLWAIAGGALPGLSDPAQPNKREISLKK